MDGSEWGRTGWGLCFRKAPRERQEGAYAGRAGRRLGQEPGQERVKARPGQRGVLRVEVRE